jgi:prephenate dehydratase
MTRVAIQGISGSYSEEAARRIFGNDVSIVECTDFDATFAALRVGNAENAVVPVENKIVGEIRQSLDLLYAGGYRVLDKLPLRVQHVLAGTPGSQIERLTSIRSHVEALKQCRRFLLAHPHIIQVVGADTASSVRRIIQDGNSANAAIGSRRAAELYGAEILAENIADDTDNWTTFYLVAN